jgi:arylformamidase
MEIGSEVTMKIIDITLNIFPGMPVWPGDDPVTLERRSKIENGDNANISYLGLSAHTGTHVDAPYHFLPEGGTVDNLSLDALVGPAQVVQVPSNVEVIDADAIDNLHLEPVVERILFKTTNSDYWVRPEDPFNQHFIAVDESGAKALVERGIKLVGIDYLSISPYKRSRPTHELLLGAGMVILEGLNLGEVSAGKYMLYCLPMKLKGADGAPARVILTEG